MIRPENQPIDSVPRDLAADLDPRTTPAEKLRRPRSSWKGEAVAAVAAAVLGSLGKKAADQDPETTGPESGSR